MIRITSRTFFLFSFIYLASAIWDVEETTAQEVPLVAALSSHLVAITAGFTGTDVLLFGATDGPGDIAVVVRGPTSDTVVRRKERLGPIWVNGTEAVLRDAPSYYRVASNRPLKEIASKLLLSQFQIGLENIRLISANQVVDDKITREFRNAFIDLKLDDGLYDQGLGAVNFMSNRLFRTELHFPAHVPTGTYLVEVYLFRDGQVTSAEIVPLNISKIGVGADIYDFAHNLAFLYGLMAVILAIAAGWAASAAFRRV
ncbi:MAG TPA: hypothetical protein DGZ24_00495 [Rhodospirillaceae bacterium]|nr:hypothetical protein [Candidatus Neomarinimicrobiota bacterium]HCX13774.1 hypothetical protein [Rhodospirillaceae bacterium]